MLITLERLVAVYIPLRFALIITPTRTWVALVGVSLYWMIYIAYTFFWFQFTYTFDPDLGREVGLMERTDLFYKDLDNIDMLNEVYFSIKIPPAFTLVGCVLIVIKVNIASKKRRQMTSQTTSQAASHGGKIATKSKSNNSAAVQGSDGGSGNEKGKSGGECNNKGVGGGNKGSGGGGGISKTTKTLLSVCFFYMITCIVISLPSYLPKEYMSYSLTTDKPSNLAKITYQSANIVGLFNSSCNFVIYIFFNKNFQQTYKDIVGGWWCCRRFVKK